MGRTSLYFRYRGQAFKDSVGPQIQDAILFLGGSPELSITPSLKLIG